MPARARTVEEELAGYTLAGRYDLLAMLGAGGMGAVYRAHDRELDELVALKVIKSELAQDPAMVDRFRYEVKLARRVTHVNVARTFELGQADGVMYCTMELVEGESLRHRMERDRRLSIADAAGIAGQLCEGLAAAHAAGVIHRDIKPDNVLISAEGRVVLADFGVASVAAGAHTGELSGTPEYMAPEQACGEPATPATDVYAVGVLLYEMLTGQHAFTGSVTQILAAKLECERLDAPPHSMPLDLAQVIGRATAREPGARIGTAAELGRALAPWTGQAQAAPIAAPRRAEPVSADELRTIVVMPPMGDDERIHVAEGVHEALLQRLVREPRLRVLPRANGVEVPDSVVVELYAGALLSATIRRGAASTSLHLPLDIASVGLAAEAIAGAVTGAAGRASGGPEAEAHEMLLRGRMLAQRSFTGVIPALELLERAHALRPENPRIAAALAMLCVRYLVVDREDASDFARPRALVRAALEAAPELSESHVAAGHLELHTGDPVVAAAHFRTAISCSPYVAEAHEGLGRMLLETGFLDVAMARIEDALAISPNLSVVRWEVARAYALEQNWPAYDAVISELVGALDRPIPRLRCAWWRGSLQEIAGARRLVAEQLDQQRVFETAFIGRIYQTIVDRTWAVHRDALVTYVRRMTSPSLRRRAFVAQLCAETAGFAGDAETCLEMIDYAVGFGLYDLHWLDRCPLIAPVRGSADFARLRVHVKRRAEAILDALYGDGKALSDTIVA